MPELQCTKDQIDNFFCLAALRKGYDSIQILNSFEFIYCNGRCSVEPLKSGCPLIDFYTSINRTSICNCNPMSDMANCGNNFSNPLIWGPQYKENKGRFNDQRHFTCFNQLFDIEYLDTIQKSYSFKIGFTSDIVNDIQKINAEKHVNITKVSKYFFDNIDILLDIKSSTSFVDKFSNNYSTLLDSYDIVYYENNIHYDKIPLSRKYRISEQYHQNVSITTKIIRINDNINVGIISIIALDDLIFLDIMHNNNITNTYHYVKDAEFIRWITDEAMCLYKLGAVAIVVLSKESYEINELLAMVCKYIYI